MGYIFFNETKFYSHPIYDSYYASKKGEIYSIKRNKLLKLGKHKEGYLYFILFKKKHKENIIWFIGMFTSAFVEIYQKIKWLTT